MFKETKKSKELKIFRSRAALIDAVHASMPDEYPRGFAVYMADFMIKNGEAVIEKLNKTR